MPQEVPCTLLCKALGLGLLPCYPLKTARWTSGLFTRLTNSTIEAKGCLGSQDKAVELGSAAHPTGQCVTKYTPQGERPLHLGDTPEPQPQDVRPAERTRTHVTMKCKLRQGRDLGTQITSGNRPPGKAHGPRPGPAGTSGSSTGSQQHSAEQA